ncbi:hypothetical protein GJ496_001095 [Pomphorhynchus laevis]|nr:hypothetical protein GJ496_001095 [Pomphorhynchus laevis]
MVSFLAVLIRKKTVNKIGNPKMKRRWALIFVVFFVIYLCSILYRHYEFSGSLISDVSLSNIDESKRQVCFSSNVLKTIDSLAFLIDQMANSKFTQCRFDAKLFQRQFDIEEISATVKFPKPYKLRLIDRLGNNMVEELENNQPILKLYHKWFIDESIYCSLRGKRPATMPKISDIDFVKSEISELSATCDFCKTSYLNASDESGRLETEFSFTAANSFKYDKWHELVFSRNHNPLNLSLSEFSDMFMLAIKWVNIVAKIDHNAVYPSLFWDAMSKSGASQIHTHLHVSLGRLRYCAVAERLIKALGRYYEQFHRDMLADFVYIHQFLDLTYKNKDAVLILNLNAQKDYEFLVIGKSMDKDFIDLLYFTMKAYIDDFTRYSFSLGCYLKPVNTKDTRFPYTYCHVIFRDYISSVRNDFNGLDLFMSSVLSADKFDQMKKLRLILQTNLKGI